MKKEFYKMEYEAWDEGVEIFGTGEQALALEGAYLRLCHKMYRVRGPVSSNLNLLAKLWGVHYNTARSLLQKLVDHGKVTMESGGAHIINSRASQELHDRGILSAVRAQSGRSGGEASGESRRTTTEVPDNQLNLFMSDEAIASSDTKQNGERREEKEEEKTESATLRVAWPDGSFEKFYSRFPNKVGKDKAIRAFNTVKKSKRVEFEDLMSGLDRYIASKPHDRPWLNPATFLNQGRWADQPAGTVAPAAPGTTAAKPAFALPVHGERVTEAMCPAEFQKKHIGRVFLQLGSEEWQAWLFHLNQQARAEGKPPPIVPYYFNDGWTFRERWPPGHVQSVKASDNTGVN